MKWTLKLDGFLLAMFAAVAAAIAAPRVGAEGGLLPMGTITSVGIALVFFLHGVNLAPAALKAGAANWRLQLCIQGFTFLFFPLLGLAIYHVSAGLLPAEMRLGVFFLCALCSTISSSVALVAIAGGSVGAAVFGATISGLVGMVVTPLLLLTVGIAAKGHPSVLNAIGNVAVQLLLPFVAGQLTRPLLGTVVAKYKPLVTRADRTVIVLIVYASFCESTAAGLWSRYDAGTLLLIVPVVAVLLSAGLWAATFTSRALGFSRADEIALVFCGSTKSLANGAPIAKVIFGASPALGMILLPLMMYHQLQLIVCSSLAKRYAGRTRNVVAFDAEMR